MLERTYNWMMTFAAHPSAVWVMSAISFAESSFFPIPPDPLFIAMGLRHPYQIWNYCIIATVTSVLGGYLGYLIGFSLFETWGQSILDMYGLHNSFNKFQLDFQKWGFWLICLKGLTPIPYKIVTIASGVAQIDLLTFTFASLVARGFRFTYVSFLLWRYGEKVKSLLDRYLTLITLATVGILVLGFIILKWIW
ncbi:DedA family protein [Alphaproteobacteria bacterium]|nr:DedA family protein [Alphaproteobacteria bacterium]